MNQIFSKIAFGLIITALATLTSCKVDHGKPCIEKEKMAEIIYESYITEGTLDKKAMPAGHKRPYYYCHILEQHGVTEAEFDSALNWYSRNSDEFKKVHEIVNERLRAEKEKLQ